MTAPATVPGIKATPILFSAPMIRALLEGRKTQTRRPVKGTALDWLDAAGFDPAFVAAPENGLCPYGSPGDLLWCRETWQGFIQTSYEYDEWREAEASDIADSSHLEVEYRATSDSQPSRWRPSIHMPRWASRLTLELTGVRVERLSGISEVDAFAEGVRNCGYEQMEQHEPGEGKALYQSLWESLHGEGSWATNPWLWALEFRVYQQNIDAFLGQRRAA